jgi:DNA-directed RNA polymerase specialized sigma subunit
MALEGLRSYDPAGASLKTYLTGHLQGLKRVNRRQTTILKVPERVSLDRYHLDAAVKDYEAVHGVEPSDGQLADHAGFSVDRIRRVRSYRPAAAEGTVEAATGGDVFGASSPFAPKGETAWQKLVYDDLAPADQRVVDMHRAGLPNQEIARRLGVTPGAVSQRKARIQALFDQEDDLSPF